MTDSANPNDADRTLIADLLVRWEEAWERGEDVTAEAVCGDREDLVGAVADGIDRLRASAWMNDDPATAGGGPGDPPMTGTLAGRYRIEAIIGEGGHGRVYRAFDEELERAVAVKVASTARPSPDLLTEARRVAKLRHPNIVAVHDAGRHDDRLFLVSDLIDGRTLADVIADGPLPGREAAVLIAAVADALAHAHAMGFVHRDLKPSNVLIDDGGRPHVTDFGIAATPDELADGRAVSAGTLAYASPEQVAGETGLIDRRTDIYSLGVVLFETLSGRLPYTARTPAAMREDILFRSPARLREVAPTAPPGLDAVCTRCLAKHPAERFQTAAEVAEAVRSEPPRQTSTAPRFPWRSFGVALLAFVTFALGLLAGAWPDQTDERFVRDGAMHFDGRTRIVTAVERRLPVTLEAWVRPAPYETQTCGFVIGSDIPTKYGLGLAVCYPVLTAEHAGGAIHSPAAVPAGEWSHIAGVFTGEETRLYLNGRLAATGPGGTPDGETVFVIGNVGKDNPLDYFRGDVRTVRITEGERYAGRFDPEPVLKETAGTLLLVTPGRIDGEIVTGSGDEVVGRVQRAMVGEE